MKHEVNAMGKQCPIPVVMTKKVIDNAAVGDEIEILIDNETAVNNLSRLANKTGCRQKVSGEDGSKDLTDRWYLGRRGICLRSTA